MGIIYDFSSNIVFLDTYNVCGYFFIIYLNFDFSNQNIKFHFKSMMKYVLYSENDKILNLISFKVK